jgi:hypothetical protein
MLDKEVGKLIVNNRTHVIKVKHLALVAGGLLGLVILL